MAEMTEAIATILKNGNHVEFEALICVRQHRHNPPICLKKQIGQNWKV